MTTVRLGALARACTAALCALGASPALADATGPALPPALQKILDGMNVAMKNKDSFTFDYGIPTSPALALIGTSNALSSPSASMKPYVFSVPASWGGAKDSQAFAFDVSAVWAGNAFGAYGHETYADYMKEDYFGRLAYRTRLEGALSLGDDGGGDASKAKPSRLAFGASTSLLDSSDPLTATGPDGQLVWDSCVNGVFDGSKNVQYQAAYNTDSNVLALNSLAYTIGQVRRGLQFGGDTPSDAYVDDAYIALSDCLKAGQVCAKYDDGGAIQAAFDARKDAAPAGVTDKANNDAKLRKALAALNAVEQKVSAAIDVSSGALAQKFDIPKALDACVTAANAAARLGSDLDVGAGIVWNGKPGSVDGLSDASGALWISGRIAFGGFANDITKLAPDTAAIMLGGALRANWSQTLATGVAATPLFKADVYDAWVGLERYTASSRVAAQIGYMDSQAIDPAFKTFSKSGTRWLVSASIRADKLLGGLVNGSFLIDKPADAPQNGVWVNLTYGTATGTVTTLDDKTVMVSLSYSPSDPYNLFGEGTN